MEHEPDIALPVQRLGHQVRRGHAIAIVVGRYDRHIVLAGFKACRHVVHEDELGASFRGRLVGGGRRRRIRRDRDDDIRLLRHDRFDVGDLFFRLEAGVGHRKHLDAHRGELCLKTVDLGA